jgi:site-specific recombinase XerD
MNEFAISLVSRSPGLDVLIEQAARFLEGAKAKSTRYAYARDLADFRLFTERHGFPYLPSNAQIVALYISGLATRRLSVSTIRRRMAAITNAHKEAGFANSPTSPRQHYVVREVLAGIKRSLGTAQHGVDPLLADDIRKIVAATPDKLIGLRDRALVLVGFSGAFRRSELATTLEVDDLHFTDQGVHIRVRHSKTDQEGQGRTVAIPMGEHPETCPVRALQTWLAAAGITATGPVFRSVDRHGRVADHALCPRSIAKILKCAATRAGMDATSIAGHSLRAGMITQAALNGSKELEIARTTGHRSEAMVRRYIRVGDPFQAIGATRLGL